MLRRPPKPAFWKFVKGSAKTLFVVEAVLFAASYGFWYRMNTNREFRHYINENCPYLLDKYYQIGELFGDTRQRELDFTLWKKLE